MDSSNDKKSDADEGGRTPAGSNKQMHKCGNPDCPNSHRAELPDYLYNIACNYRKVTDAGLLPLIRCRNCAKIIAEQNRRKIGEQGCGVFPLNLTLQQMHRREDDPIPDGAVTYGCAKEGCKIRRRAEDMYNLGIGRVPENVESVLAHIVLCGDHAREVAALKGKGPCDSGSGVYRLSHTLRWFREAPKPE